MPRTISGRGAYAAFNLLLAITHPVTSLAIFGAIPLIIAIPSGKPWLIAVTAVAAAAAFVAIVTMVRGDVDPMERRMHTVFSGYVSDTQLAVVVTTMIATGSIAGAGALIFGVLALAATTWSFVARSRFLSRIRRAGGVSQAARVDAQRIIDQRPNEAHLMISRASVDGRDASRLHWRYAQAMSDENVALYVREAEAEAASGPSTGIL